MIKCYRCLTSIGVMNQLKKCQVFWSIQNKKESGFVQQFSRAVFSNNSTNVEFEV